MSTKHSSKSKVITFGEALLRICPSSTGKRLIDCSRYIITPAGSEMNVAVALCNLGMPAAFVSALPKGELGSNVLRQLKKNSVDVEHVINNSGRMGLFFQERGAGVRPSTVLYDRASSAFSKAKINDFDWQMIFYASHWFHTSGIVPALSPETAGSVNKIKDKIPKNIMFSIDLNYRNKLWGWAKPRNEVILRVMSRLCQRADVIMANETDLQNVFGFNESIKREEQAAQIFKRFKRIKYLSISLRVPLSATRNRWSGELYVRIGNKAKRFSSREYMLDSIIDRVGTGDSFSAGIIYGISDFEQDYQKVIDFAVALSALNHSTYGDFSAFSKSEVLHAMASGGDGRILR